MDMRIARKILGICLALVALSWGVDTGWAQPPDNNGQQKKNSRITAAQRKAAATRVQALGLQPGVASLAATAIPAPGDLDGPGGIPHYFGPYGNWAYTPLPKGPVTTVTLVDGGTGYNNPLVTIDDVYGTGASVTFQWTATLGVVDPITVPGGAIGADFSAPIATITDNTDLCGGVSQPACGTGATADAVIGGTLTGGIRKFVDGLPGLGPGNANLLGQYIPVAVPDPGAYPGSDYYEIAVVEYNEKMHSDLPPTRQRAYVQLATTAVPGDNVALMKPDGITPILMPDGSQAYGVTFPHFLGPTIVGTSNRPVRVKFYNLLPTGAEGDLFIPVDPSVMGAGFGPAGPGTAGNQTYTQNRASTHLHGNNTVWISDGTPHQWITPANEITPYPQGVSARNVPDMPGCELETDGCSTFYYTNAMSARLMFYHDHAYGITRLNVYAGMAAGYLLTDTVDQDMINGTNDSGVNPGLLHVLPDLGIPLVIQDRTFVDNATIGAQDPTWNWGTGPRFPSTDPRAGLIQNAVTGDLWVPHVYMSAQNPWDLSGVNAFGRWHYGPWFNPPTPTCDANHLPAGCIDWGPVANPFHQPICDTNPADPTCTAPWEPPMMPGTPNPSIAGEAFNDTPTVNGTLYPYLVVDPKPVRFRILNAANDRMFNLQLYVAADKNSPTTAGTTGAVLCDGINPVAVDNCTEVAMRLVTQADQNQTAATPSGLPNDTLPIKGPDWWQIGTEGGFLAAPAVIPTQPIGWNMDPTAFNVGNVNQHSLLLGTAERADVVVDFSAYAGKTLILYNDAPAAFPAGVPTYDYYTGVANQMDVGGAPTTQPGYGPNTRTIMQIQVRPGVPTPTEVTLANLQAVFAKTTAKRGVFEVSQDPIIIPQAAYNSAYNNTFPSTAPTQMTFRPIGHDGVLQPAVTIPLQMKAMHDEMGGVYDTMFGRMSGMLGLTNPMGPAVGNILIPYGYASPPTDVIRGSEDINAAPIGSLADGTQIWRIFHNGVDSHTIHVHLFNAQLINRIGQDGIQQRQEPGELGWKDTFIINPLEITFLAMRPVLPTQAQVPFEVPDSVRLIDPTLPEGATLYPPAPAGWFDPNGNAIPEILNHYVNFGWEYVWHCHILAHEEMDMMHTLVAAAPPLPPTALAATWNGNENNPRVTLNWQDNSSKEARFRIERATDSNFTTGLTTFTYVNPNLATPNTVTYQDRPPRNYQYWYRVIAEGYPVGDTQTAGFPTMTADSAAISTSVVTSTSAALPADPTNLTAILQVGPQVSLTWRDNATNETGFVVERCTGAACTNFAQIAEAGPRNNTGNVTYVDTSVTAGNSYSYQVRAINGAGSSGPTIPPASVDVPAIPAAPASFTVGVAKANGNNYTATLAWASGVDPTNFTIQRSTSALWTTNLTSFTVAGTDRSLTQTVSRNTTYYYRIRANNAVGGSSVWVNAMPFPIRTGN